MLPDKPSRSTEKHRDGDCLRSSGVSNRSIALNIAPPHPGPSNVLSKLSTLSKRATSPVESEAPLRTSSFADKAR